MMRIPQVGISALLSFAAGAALAGWGVVNYEMKSEGSATQTVRTVSDTGTPSPTPTPTYDMTPQGVGATPTPTVEGDDGSLGGPVYNEANQATPTYIVNTPTAEPTSENANDDDTASPTPTESKTSEAQAPVHEAPAETPTASPTPSHDDHQTGVPSDDPTAG